MSDDNKPRDASKTAKKDTSRPKDVGLKLREALKQQLAIIHERVEAKKLARLALTEVRLLLAKEEEVKELELGRTNMSARVRERVAARLREEEERMEREEIERALEKLRMDKNKQQEESKPGKEETKPVKEESKPTKEDRTVRRVEAKVRERPKKSKSEQS